MTGAYPNIQVNIVTPQMEKVISHHFRYVFEPAETPIFCG